MSDHPPTSRVVAARPFRFIEKIMIQHAHPLKLTVDVLGILLGWYLLWTQHLAAALLALFGGSCLGTMLVWTHDLDELAASPLGTWMRGQAHPLNLLLRSSGFFLICYGLWVHTVSYLPVGLIIIMAARWSTPRALRRRD